LAVFLVSLLCIPTSCGAFELTSLQFSPLQRFSKFPIPHAVVRNQQVTFGWDALLWCKTPLFGGHCATIAQPKMRRFFWPFVEPCQKLPSI